MKKTMRFLSLAAIALVGAVMTGCSNEDDFTVEPENKSNVVTLTTTVGIGGGAETRALSIDYENKKAVKTFAAGEQLAVIYKNTSGTTVKAVSAALTAGDIQSGSEGKTATFTFTLENPDKGQDVKYIYPAAMAGETDVDYSNLNSQDGSLATLSSNLDLATYSGAWDGASLPSATLTNQLALLAVTLKDADGSNDITSSITGMTISDGTNTYTVSPSSLSTIYVAILPTASAKIDVTATDGSTNYTKSLTGKTYEAGNGYNVSWRMTELVPATGHALSASVVGEIVCSDGLAYAAADKNNLPTGVTAVAIVAYLGDGDTSDNTYNNGLAIAMSDADGDYGSNCGWGDWGATYHCVSESNDIATAIGYKDGISSTNTLTSDDHYHEAATAAASNNGTAAPTGTSGWFLPSIGQWNLIVQGLASKKAGSAVTEDITQWDENDTYKASNLNSVITDAGGTGFNGGYHSSTQYDSESCWHMNISDGRAWGYGFSAGDYVRSVLAF